MILEWDEHKRRSKMRKHGLDFRYSASIFGMSRRVTSKRSQTDWARIDALRDEDIDFSDIPEVTPAMFARSVVRRGLRPVPPKEQITLRLDADVLKWFRSQGRGYQTQINALLRAYMQASAGRRSGGKR